MCRSRNDTCALTGPSGNYESRWHAVLLLSALSAGCGEVSLDATRPSAAQENRFSEPFDTLDPNNWGCEYSCPTVSESRATFTILPGVAPRNEGSWSKIHYKPQRFTAGSFAVRFALGPRPGEPLWWGVALYDEGPELDESEYSEIYFGYRTDGSLSDTQMLLESARFGNATAIEIDTGVDLYDGTFHTGRLVYDSTHIALYLDGELLQTITDTAFIPTAPMSLVLGTRLVEEPVLSDRFDEIIDHCDIEW